MFNPICIWPYSALASVHYDHTGTTLQIWIIFKYPMDTSVKPPLAKWDVVVNLVGKTPVSSSWIDEWSLTLVVINIPAYPNTVTCAYDGPDEDLRTSWNKQWEPFGPITGIAMPYNWQNVLDIDVPNERVTVNGTLLLTHKTIFRGTYNDLDVSGINILLLNSSTGDIIINGFSNGVNYQLLFLVINAPSANDITLSHESVAADEPIHLHAGADETLTNLYGGWNLLFLTSSWFDISHAKHV